MKRLLYYLMALWVVSACVFDFDKLVPSVRNVESEEEKLVSITFSVPGVRLAPSTKGLESGDGNIAGTPYLDPDKLFLVVCGGSQSIKYVRKAEVVKDAQGQPIVRTIPKTDPEFERVNYPLPEGEEVPESIDLYSFSVQLELSDSKRTIHFLGNIDENQLITGSYSYEVLPYLLSFEGKQAYWQKLVTSIMNDDTGIDPQTGCYSPDDSTKAHFRYIPLIRNFAEIKVTNLAKQFKLHSYAVVFTPKQGAVVPYRHNLPAGSPADSCFTFTTDRDYRLSGYENCTIHDLEDIDKFNYPGNLPAGVAFTDTSDVPKAEMFINPSISNGRVILYDKDAENGFFVYEREVPSDNRQPTFIILCGRGLDKDESEEDYAGEKFYYYRMDLIDSKSTDVEHSADYYPIYRNFRYDIKLNRVASVGVEDPLLACLSTGAEDISADVSMKHLSDISNGVSRLVVDPFMAHTFTGPQEDTVKLYVRFFDDVEDAKTNTYPNAVQVTLEPMADGGDDIVVLYNDNGTPVHTMFPKSQVKQGEEGWRIVRFNLKKMPDDSDPTRTQIIKITGRNSKVEEIYPLYRQVEITLQGKQDMMLDCNTLLPPARGIAQTLTISIPDSLVQSMFPLDFIIEADSLSLTPVSGNDSGHNLPVKSGKSLSGNGKNTFQFIRTLTWDEYSGLASSSSHQRSFQCFFKTTRAISRSTIRVYNEYFKPNSIWFDNDAVPTDHFYVMADDADGCYVRLINSDMEYRRYEKRAGSEEWTPVNADDGEWTTFKSGLSIPVNPGQKVAFRYAGDINKKKTSWKDAFYCRNKNTAEESAKDGKFKVGGNIASLIVGELYVWEGKDVKNGFSFLNFFKGHTNLTDASELVLPMLTCQNNCFQSMFEGCSSLVSGPSRLPATKTASQCYKTMFLNCTSLVNAPVIANATLGGGSSYVNMFDGCTSLSRIVFLGTSYQNGYFTQWVRNVAGDGVFVTPENAAIRHATRGEFGIPENWTIQKATGNE